jgi:hypothetical protein
MRATLLLGILEEASMRVHRSVPLVLAAIGLGASAAIAAAPSGRRQAPHLAPGAGLPTFESASRGHFIPSGPAEQSVARLWNERLLASIRLDFARPTIHARNLFHCAIVTWDAWAAYDEHADGWLSPERHSAVDVEAARNEAISFAMYRLLRHRFVNSPGAPLLFPTYDALMDDLGYDRDYTGTVGNDPASFGNRCAANMIAFGLTDGSNEAGGYDNLVYQPVNEPVIPDFEGNHNPVTGATWIPFPNRWQPISVAYFVDQGGNPIPGGYPPALSPEWGIVKPFSLSTADRVIYQRDDFDWWVYHDPGPPPFDQGVGDDYYKWGFALVSIWQSHHDPSDGVMWDISPASVGNAPLPDVDQYEDFYDLYGGGDWGEGYDVNPATGLPYDPQIVPRGDYARILAEFWADGPNSETPPGHWFSIFNYVADHPDTVKRIGGIGDIVPNLEWDVKGYLALGGALHDAAVSCWGAKGWYDYVRPISAIRYMSDNGQSSEPTSPSYHPSGLPLHPGFIEIITEQSIQPGERHEHLAGNGGANVGKIAAFTWRGPPYISDPMTDVAGVGWILAGNFWPYQRPTFVSPPFPGYYSGHSTYSRTAANVMTAFTGDEYFPGGMGQFLCPQNAYLVFEDGPSVDVTLQWARYEDASDQCSLSRIWGGIHPPADDLPGRHRGNIIGPEAWQHAKSYFSGAAICPGDLNDDDSIGFADMLHVLSDWGPCPSVTCYTDINGDGVIGFPDLLIILGEWGSCGG